MPHSSFARRVNAFNRSLDFKGSLPPGIRIMNPFKEDAQTLKISDSFYMKFYDDSKPRHIILGINPGRFGAGVTGVPFTDTKRLRDECGITYHGRETHEPSSVFVYEMIKAFGGVETFYAKFYINSISPLGFTAVKDNGKEVNYNYYDSKELTEAVKPFIIESIEKQLEFGVRRDVGFCLGSGKNEHFLRKLNDEKKYFEKIIALEHPRFIMQYRSRTKQDYIDKYLSAFRKAG
ncbi:MAG: DUF4918 family protein [Bacteroidota bacterium]|nr:DUF4918 family protein [Bacteroidota bacterium]